MQALLSFIPVKLRRRPRIAFALLAVLSCLAAPANSLFKPTIYWDLLAHVGIVKSWSLPDAAAVQTTAYAEVHRFAETWRIPGFQDLIDESAYRRAVAADPAAFAEQLPFYRIRPVSLWLVSVVANLMPTVAAAVSIVAALATLSVSLLIAVVALRQLGAWAGGGVVLTVALSPIVIGISGSLDSVFVQFVAAGVVLLGFRRDLAGVLVLVSATAVRSEGMLVNLLLAFALAAEALVARKPAGVILPAVLAAGSIALGQTIAHLVGGYPFRVLNAVTYIDRVPHPAALANQSIPLSVILTAWRNGTAWALSNSGLWAVMAELVALGILLSRQGGERTDRLTAITIGLAGYTIARLIVFPEQHLRFNAPAFIALAILLTLAAGTWSAAAGRAATPSGHPLPAA